MLATYTLSNCGGLVIEDMTYRNDCYKVKVRLSIVDEEQEKKPHWYKVYYTADGERTYFNWGRIKIYLDECMRVEGV